MMKKDSRADSNVLSTDEEIVRYLYINPYKQKQKDFYQNLTTKALENLVGANFGEKDLDHEEGVFVVTLIKKQPSILLIAFEREAFNFMRLFDFLKLRLTLSRVRALEEMLIPFCKKYPQKVLELLADNDTIKELLLSKLYLRSIFKIVYTTVFCLQEKQAKTLMPICKEILAHVARSLFIFSAKRMVGDREDEFLDVVEVVENFKDFLMQLIDNLTTVYLPLLIDFISILDDKYINQVLILFQTQRTNKDQHEFCESLIQVLLNMLKILQFLKLRLDRQSSKQQLKLLNGIEKRLLDNAICLAQKLSIFIILLLQNPSSSLVFSSGEVIPMVGMIRYRILELIEKLLSINQLCDLKIDFKTFDFFPVIEHYIQNHKWNNIIHNLLLRIAQLIISQDYDNFSNRYITSSSDFENNIFGHLIANFRNRKYIFLHSFRMMNNGQRCPIFQLSHMLVNQIKERNDLSLLLKKFKLWKEFMEIDLKQFQKENYKAQKVEEQSLMAGKRKSRARSFQISRSSSIEMRQGNKRSLETFDQILNQIKQGDRWKSEEQCSPQKKISQKRQFIRHFDSIGQFQDFNQN